jgi:hypothetical protein
MTTLKGDGTSCGLIDTSALETTRDELEGYIASSVTHDAEPVAWLRFGEPTPMQGVPFGANWITDKGDPRGFPVYTRPTPQIDDAMVERRFKLGERVRKSKGASWQGTVVGFYSTTLTPIGYAVESELETGSVQIYPEAALEAAIGGGR